MEENEDVQIDVDVNTEMFPVREKDVIEMLLMRNIVEVEALTEYTEHDPRNIGKTIMDEYDYVTYGVCYERKTDLSDVCCYVSFGGLLLRIQTLNKNPNNLLRDLKVDDRVYCLMRINKDKKIN